MMKRTSSLVFLIALLFAACDNNHQETTKSDTKKNEDPVLTTPMANPYAEVDKSPMDMSYFPVEYPKLKMSKNITTPPVMRVIYSRPHREGRVIFGSLLKYGVQWRLGANESSEIEFFQPVKIQDKKVDAGRYLIYCIPYPDKWTIILNSNIYTWGLHIDSTKDLMKFDIPATKITTNVEYFTMVFQKADQGATLVMAWDDTEARLPINF